MAKKQPSVTKKKTGMMMFKTEDNRSSFLNKKSRKSAGNPTTSGGMPSTFSNPPLKNSKNSDQRKSNFLDEFDKFEEQFEQSRV